MKIAASLTVKDWTDLNNLLDNNKDDNWGTAFNFFEQRVYTRYLVPIHAIIDLNYKAGEGFSVVNLQCSLIETIESFYNGWLYIYPNFYEKDGKTKISMNNSNIFESFFDNREPFKSLSVKISGKTFYRNVRCGLLHETQTKDGWVIMADGKQIYEEIGSQKIVYRNNFQKALIEVIKDYKKEIESKTPKSTILRENFRAKFSHLCNKS